MKPHLHFMGVAGVGMSGLARWYLADGYPVSGCDALDSGELHTLRRQGVTAYLGHDASHVDEADILVSSMAVPLTHPDFEPLVREVADRVPAAGLVACQDAIAQCRARLHQSVTPTVAFNGMIGHLRIACGVR